MQERYLCDMCRTGEDGAVRGVKVEVGLHQGSPLIPFLFVSMAMDRLTDEVIQESPWAMMFADVIGMCGWSRAQVEVCLGEENNEVTNLSHWPKTHLNSHTTTNGPM